MYDCVISGGTHEYVRGHTANCSVLGERIGYDNLLDRRYYNLYNVTD